MALTTVGNGLLGGAGLPRSGSHVPVPAATATSASPTPTTVVQPPEPPASIRPAATTPSARPLASATARPSASLPTVLPSARVPVIGTSATSQPVGVPWGLYNPGFPGNISAIQSDEAAVGKHAAIVMWYIHWGGPWNAFNPADVQAVLAHNSTPMITWMSDDYTLPGYPNTSGQSGYTDAKIAAGNFDPYIKSWADGLRAAGKPVLLRLDHEMNGNWYAWDPGINGNTSAQYIAMWRHVHSIFVQEGATNVMWVWSPNVDYFGATPMASLYPGDGHVDWVGLDGYNWGSTNPPNSWASFSSVFGPSYTQVLTITGKPLMIAETSSVEVGAPAGQSKATWITSALSGEIPQSFPRVRALVWFDQNNGNGQDFRIASTAASLQAFAAAIQSSYYLPTFTRP